ncbi:hypothetical protein [Microbacterium sp.]|uniref:hypothetical protein n=1 Tax=Microbacterium sp. TaxID=51671 RepID=UPI0039E2AFF7
MTGTLTRTRVTIAAIVAGMLLALGAGTPAWADSNDDLVAVDARLSTAVNSFADVYTDQSTTEDQVVTAAQTLQSEAETAQSDFATIAQDAGDATIAGFANEFATEAGDMATAAGDIVQAFADQDSSALTAAEDALNTALGDYQATADKYNQYAPTVSDPAFVLWLIVLIVAVVFLILALLFALLTRKQEGLLPAKVDKKGNVQQASLKRLRWMVVLWAGLFVVGAAIPFFQVIFAQPDASGAYTYRVFWYPLAAGAVLSVVGVVQYFVAAARVRREGSAAAHDPNAIAAPGTEVPAGAYPPAAPDAPFAPPAGTPDAQFAPPATPPASVAALTADAAESPAEPSGNQG